MLSRQTGQFQVFNRERRQNSNAESCASVFAF